MSKFDPIRIDLSKLTLTQLETMYKNNKKHGRKDVLANIIGEAKSRNLRTGCIVGDMPWNQQKVREALLPFKKISESVAGNKRTTYTEAGGLKIGRAKGDPDKHYIDSYSRIQTDEIDALFICYVKDLDSDATFNLNVAGEESCSYNADQLPSALEKWQAVAEKAKSK